MEKDIEPRSFLITEDLGVGSYTPPPTPEHPAQHFLDQRALVDTGQSDFFNGMRDEIHDWLEEDIEETTSAIPVLLDRIPTGESMPIKEFKEKKPVDVGQPSTAQFYVTPLRILAQEIITDLHKSQRTLLSLNRSRRQALYEHLSRVGGLSATSSEDPLREWLSLHRTPEQEKALLSYFEEVALMYLAQVFLLKSWSDRGIRTWRTEDLGHVNWSLCHTIRPKVPLNRGGWQITRPNLYSWYSPSKHIQEQIARTVREWDLKQEGPSLLSTIFLQLRKNEAKGGGFEGYDDRFYSGLWSKMASFGFDAASLQKNTLATKSIGFCPTLRDGGLLRAGPQNLEWVGLESYSFQLLMSEILLLWREPSPAPMWGLGNGLESHQREQLQMSWGPNGSHGQTPHLSDIESARIAFVLEEKAVRAQGRNAESFQFKKQVEQLPYFKKMRGPTSTLGGLQACVAMTKLRPGGLLWWAREEPLSPTDGSPLLRFLFEKARLICEWDLSGMQHSLPLNRPIFPRYLYFFARDYSVENRRDNRPLRVKATGWIRSHIEVPRFIDEALRSAYSDPPTGTNWKIFRNQSPNTQQEWLEHWPGQEDGAQLTALEDFRKRTVPLGQLATVRQIQERESLGSMTLVPLKDEPLQHCLELSASSSEQGPALRVIRPGNPLDASLNGHRFLVAFPDNTWLDPIAAYLESQQTTHWLKHFGESRKGKIVLKEQSIKFLPIPKALVEAIKSPVDLENSRWADFAFQLPYEPLKVLKQIQEGLAQGQEIPVAALFVKAIQNMEAFSKNHGGVFQMVGQEGQLNWKEIVSLLPERERVALPLHHEVRISGMLPPHVAILRIERSQHPIPGVRFSTEKGMSLHLGSANRLLVELIWDLVKDLEHPTWGEIAQGIKLCRDTDILKDTGNEILRSHSEQDRRRKELLELIRGIQF